MILSIQFYLYLCPISVHSIVSSDSKHTVLSGSLPICIEYGTSIRTFEPQFGKATFFCMCAPWRLKSACASTQFDLSRHCPHDKTWHPLQNMLSKDPDETAPMRRLIWIFAGHSSQKVLRHGLFYLQVKSHINVTSAREHLYQMVYSRLISGYTQVLNIISVCCVKHCSPPMVVSNVTCQHTVKYAHLCVRIARKLSRLQWTARNIWKHTGRLLHD